MLTISFKRKSVCMGDDAGNGEYMIEMPDNAVLGDLINVIKHGGNGCDWPIPYTGANSFWVVKSNIGNLADIYTDKDGEWNIRYLAFPETTPLKSLGITWTFGDRDLDPMDKKQDLSKYDNTTVRIVCENGDTFTGACEWDDPEYNLHEYNVKKESLRIGEYIFFRDNINAIELLRNEACFPVRDWPEAKEEIALWFHERWHIPLEAYRESITDCLGRETGIPQWYVVVRGNKIIAGCGVIENDFHERKDLTPNVCAVYVDEKYRDQGIAGLMLQYVCDDMSAMGIDTLYLLTDHTGFYERYEWQFLCMVRGDDGELSRMYVHR